jgi:1,4-alpha-glucan branching enzyme
MWAHPGKKLLFMGQEFAQNDEWSESAGLQWHLDQYDEHSGVAKTISQINSLYKSTPALFEKDTSPEGFSWLVGNDAASNVLAFTRWAEDGQPLVCITNFSPVPHENYRLPMPKAGSWREVLNTDDLEFGGSGVINQPVDVAEKSDLVITLRVAPLATLWLALAKD